MSTTIDQTERSFQKQPHVFLNRKTITAVGKKKSKKPLRWVRNIGLGFKTPQLAKEGNYIDKKCPFTGNVSIRGRILTGVVMKMKMQRTIVIRRDYLHYVKKYARFEKRHKNMSVHLSPCFRDVKVGDIVTVGECRPLSKTVRFNVIKVTKAPGSKKAFENPTGHGFLTQCYFFLRTIFTISAAAEHKCKSQQVGQRENNRVAVLVHFMCKQTKTVYTLTGNLMFLGCFGDGKQFLKVLLRSDFLLTYYSNPKSYCDCRHRFFTHLRRNYCKITRIVMTARAEFQISPSITYCVRQVNNDVSNGILNASVKNVDLNDEVFSVPSVCRTR
ncbi:40S ribosomal protein S11 [Trichinella spiralis]|uniref:40S ribosomal protein S11 n=1 Tax=Trichinella spiralis TaxID=6334 RepID=UPI0001EFC3AD|nr:40S ribosomal protein S11 [Trichinella spiralis]